MSSLANAFGVPAETVMGLLAALGSGLLIGLERERNKGSGRHREPAGLRTFTLVALAGALAQALAAPGLVAAGALGVTALAAIAYAWGRRHDPGLTTEIALLVTYLIGVLCVQAPLLGAPAAVVMTALLAARSRLHRFATQLLREDELHDGLLLGALALVVLPLMPNEPLPWLAGLKAHTLMGLMLMLLALQAAGHIALRLTGAHAGLAISGLLSGLVSSTATIATMGARARSAPDLRLACASGAVMSTTATWLQAQLMLLALAPQFAASALPLTATGMLLSSLSGWALAKRSSAGGARQAGPADPALGDGGPLRLREALILTVVLSLVTLGVSWAQQRFGATGLFGAVALASLADAHSPVASLAGLTASGQIGRRELLTGLLLAIGCNSGSRAVTAVLAGGWTFARPVIATLGGVLLLNAALLWGLLASPG